MYNIWKELFVSEWFIKACMLEKNGKELSKDICSKRMTQMNYSFKTVCLTVYTELNAQKTSAMIIKVHIQVLYH